MKSDTRKLTEGAMMVAMIGAVLFIDRQMAYAISSSAFWLYSIPLIIYGVQNDRKYTLMVAISALFVSFLIVDLQTIFYLFCALIIGVIYSEGIRQRWSQGKLLSWTIAITFVCYLLSMYVFAGFFGYDLVATRNEFIEMLENLEIFGNKVILMMDANTLFNVVDITSFFIIVVFESLIVHLLSHLIFIKLKIEVPKLVFDFKNFKYPKILSIGGILSFIAMNALQYIEVSEVFEYIIAFLYLSLFIVNLLYGMIVLRSIAQLPKVCMVIACFVPFLWPVVMMLGIVDGLLNGEIRKRGMYGQTRKF